MVVKQVSVPSVLTAPRFIGVSAISTSPVLRPIHRFLSGEPNDIGVVNNGAFSKAINPGLSLYETLACIRYDIALPVHCCTILLNYSCRL